MPIPAGLAPVQADVLLESLSCVIRQTFEVIEANKVHYYLTLLAYASQSLSLLMSNGAAQNSSHESHLFLAYLFCSCHLLCLEPPPPHPQTRFLLHGIKFKSSTTSSWKPSLLLPSPHSFLCSLKVWHMSVKIFATQFR